MRLRFIEKHLLAMWEQQQQEKGLAVAKEQQTSNLSLETLNKNVIEPIKEMIKQTVDSLNQKLNTF